MSAGNFAYRHVPEESLIGCMAAMYGFTPFTVSVGTAYFERIAARDPTLLTAARTTPEFTAFVAATPVEAPGMRGPPIGSAHIHLGPKHWCAPPTFSRSHTWLHPEYNSTWYRCLCSLIRGQPSKAFVYEGALFLALPCCSCTLG